MKTMTFNNYMEIASNGYNMLINAIDAYANNDIATCKSTIKNVLSYLHDAKFFSYISKSDFDNNEMDYDAYNPTCIDYIDDDTQLYYLGKSENDSTYNGLNECIFDFTTFNKYNMSFHSSASIIFTIFGFNLGAKLNKKFGV